MVFLPARGRNRESSIKGTYSIDVKTDNKGDGCASGGCAGGCAREAAIDREKGELYRTQQGGWGSQDSRDLFRRGRNYLGILRVAHGDTNGFDIQRGCS